jgi:nitroreductase
MRIPGGTSGWEDSPPAVIVVVGHFWAFSEERDRHLIYIDSALAIMPLMLALETLQLSSCVINFPDIPEKNAAMEKLLGLKGDEIVTMLLSVGHAEDEGLIPFSQKKSLDAIRSYNKTA